MSLLPSGNFEITPPSIEAISEFDNVNQILEATYPTKNYRFEIYKIATAKVGWASLTTVLAQVDLSINPQEYVVHEPTRQSVTQTIGGAWVDYYGLGLPRISLSGTTGWLPFSRRNDPKTKDSRTGFKPTGLIDFIMLRNLIFRQYAILLQDSNIVNFAQRVQDQMQLRFYAWDTHDYYIVLIDDFSLRRSAQRPLLYDYQITMTVIGYVNHQSVKNDPLIAIFKPYQRIDKISDSITTQLSSLQEWQQTVAKYSKAVSDAIALVTSPLTFLNQQLQTGQQYINATLKGVQDITQSLRDVGTLIENTLSIPLDIRNAIISTVRGLYCATIGLLSPDVYQQWWGNLTDNAPWGHGNCSSTMILPASPIEAMGIVGTTGHNSILKDRTVQGAISLKNAMIQEGDTVELIMQREGAVGQVASIWQEIVTINNLEYPYIVQDVNFQKNVQATGKVTFYGVNGTVIPIGTKVVTVDGIEFQTIQEGIIGITGQIDILIQACSAGESGNVDPYTINQLVNPITGVSSVLNKQSILDGKIWKVLVPGDNLQLPILLTDNSTYSQKTNILEWNLFGIDMALADDGDLVPDPTGDLDVVAGLDNMKTAVKDRLQVEQGALIKHPEYGTPIERIIGKPGDKYRLEIARVEVARSLSADIRIKNTQVVNVEIENQTANIELNLTLVDQKSQNVMVQV
jgi:phage baseplate assembly protein W